MAFEILLLADETPDLLSAWRCLILMSPLYFFFNSFECRAIFLFAGFIICEWPALSILPQFCIRFGHCAEFGNIAVVHSHFFMVQ